MCATRRSGRLSACREGPAGALAAALPGLLAAVAIAAGCMPSTREPGAPGATAAPASPAPSGPTRPYRPTPLPGPTFATYAVRAGDTLTGLARRFATTPESLAYWNRARYPSLDPDSPAYRPDRIEIGWLLRYLPGEVVDPENLPPASGAPGGVATLPSASGGPFATLPADGSAALVRRGPAGLAGVALTFEYAGGPGAGAAAPAGVVQWLEVNGVAAIVFLAGAPAPGDTAADEVVGRLATSRAVRSGLLAGTADAAALGAALAAGDAALAARLGRSTAPFLRPAGGRADAAALRAAGATGWTWAVAWDVDPGDGVAPAAGGPVATDIVARVASRASGGSIVRLQLGGMHTLEALPGIVEALAARGLAVLPLETVLGLDGE